MSSTECVWPQNNKHANKAELWNLYSIMSIMRINAGTKEKKYIPVLMSFRVPLLVDLCFMASENKAQWQRNTIIYLFKQRWKNWVGEYAMPMNELLVSKVAILHLVLILESGIGISFILNKVCHTLPSRRKKMRKINNLKRYFFMFNQIHQVKPAQKPVSKY